MPEIVFIFLFLIIGSVLITFYFLRSKERQMMIEKGLSYEQMTKLPKIKGKTSYIWLKLGVVLASIGIGLLVAYALYLTNPEGDAIGMVIAGIIVLVTGGGFIAANLIAKKLEAKEEEK